MSNISVIIRRTLKKLKVKRGKGYKSARRQIWENLMLIFRLQLEPDEYYMFGLYKKGIPTSHVLNYLISTQYSRDVSPVLNPPGWHHLLDDKLFFNIYVRSHGIPVPHQYGFYSNPYGYLTSGANFRTQEDFHDFLDREKPESLVLKPNDSYGGYKVFIFNEIQYGEEIIFRSSNGTALSQTELIERLDSLLLAREHIKGFVLEEFIKQHPVLQELYPHSVNTVRLATYLTRDNEPKIIGAFMRIGQKGKLVDNISQGGICANIELTSGTLQGGIHFPEYEEPGIEIHPDTGVKFIGMKIPYWSVILDLSRKASKAMPLQRYVGWDIAVTEAGPVFIEGNGYRVDSAFHQLRGRGILTDEFKYDMMEYGIRFPEKIPWINLRNIYQSYKISRRSNKLV